MNLKELDLTVFDRDSLMEIRNSITKELNRRTAIKRNQIKSSIQVGDLVKIDHPQLHGKRLMVEKIKIKKADIKEIGEDGTVFHPGWVVPITMLEKI
tara:strand:- start:818 stop:1108 length:291 start_codon:yes stop_codon:yes gene_type:complete